MRSVSPTEVKVLVTAHSESPTRTSLSPGKFESIIDEPPALGGTDAGPSPIQVLLMALAGCLDVTGHVHTDLDGGRNDEAAAWLEEAERRCPVTDDIKAASAVEVVIASH